MISNYGISLLGRSLGFTTFQKNLVSIAEVDSVESRLSAVSNLDMGETLKFSAFVCECYYHHMRVLPTFT